MTDAHDYPSADGRGYEIAEEGSFDVTNFRPQGPVAAAFLEDRVTKFRAIMGPWGSGKTNTAFYDMFSWAAMAPVGKGNIRRFAALVVRDTYRNLETTLKTWHAWMPKAKGRFTGGAGDRPARHELEFDLLDGTILEIIVEFRAIGDQTVEQALLGFECNWAFLNELTTLPIDVITYIGGRLGRYPAPKLLFSDKSLMDQRPARFIADLNAPEIGHPVYKYFEEDCPPTAKLYKQPGGRDPSAENLHNLPPHYYEDQITANASKPWWIKRFIDNQYGYSRAGLPVFGEEYDDNAHIAPLPVRSDLPVYLAFDGGMGIHPACTMMQWTPSGSINIVAELLPGRCMTSRFCELLAAWLSKFAPGLRIVGATIDPAAFRGENSENNEFSFIYAVNRVLKAHDMMAAALMPAPTNEIGPRLDVIRFALAYRPNGKPMLQLAEHACPGLRRAFNSEYRYKLDATGALTMEAKPEKNDASHGMDTVGYGLLAMIGLENVLRNSISMARPRMLEPAGFSRTRGGGGSVSTVATDFDVFA